MITQNHETTSRHTLSLVVACSCCCSSRAFSSRSRSAATASSTSAFTMSLHFQLHQLRRIAAGVARCAELVVGVVRILHRQPQSLKRNVSQRIRSQIFPYLFHGIICRNQFLAPRRIHSVITRRNCRRAADPHVHFRRARIAHQPHNFPAGRAAHNRIIHQHHALSLQHSTHGVQL